MLRKIMETLEMQTCKIRGRPPGVGHFEKRVTKLRIRFSPEMHKTFTEEFVWSVALAVKICDVTIMYAVKELSKGTKLDQQATTLQKLKNTW